MKKFKALSFFLAVSIVLWSSAHPIKVSAAENGIWFFEDFQNLERVYSQTSTGEPFGSNYLKFGIRQSKAETATSDDNSYLHIFANTVGGTLWLETPPNLPIKNTDKQVLEFDMYIPNGGIGNGDIVSLQMTSAVAPTTEIISFGNVSNSKAVINDYPTNSWFKIQYVFEYSAAIPRYYTKLIHQGEETFLRGHDLSNIPNLAANGFGKLRIATTSSIVSGVEFYLDNFQYYKDLTVAKSEYATSAVTDYSESFNSYGPSYNFTGTGDYGNLRVGIAAPATAKTVTHPVDGRKVLNFNTGAGNKALWVENSFPFSARTTGTQIFEVELYIPEGQLSSSVDQIGFTVKNGTSSYNLNLLSPTSTTGITTGSTANTKEFPFGKWFKIQFIFNYSSSRYEANIIDDGVIIPAAVIGGINNPFNTDGIRYFRMGHDTNASGSTKNIYVGNIRFFESDNIPQTMDFEKYEIDKAFTHGFSDVDFNAGIAHNVASAKVSFDPKNAQNKVFHLTGNSETAVAGNIYRLDMQRYLLNSNNGIVSMQYDLLIPTPLSDNEKLTFMPNYGKEIATKSVSPIGQVLRISGDKIWVESVHNPQGFTEDDMNYPVDEWFSVRLSYNTISKTYDYDMMKNDGTVVSLLRNGTVPSLEQKNLDTYGMRNFRISFERTAGESFEPVDIYIDNISIAKVNLDKLTLLESSGQYIGSLDYTSYGEVGTSTTLILAVYNKETSILQDVVIYYPQFFNGSNFIDVIAGGGTETNAKLMIVNNFGALTPLMDIEELSTQ